MPTFATSAPSETVNTGISFNPMGSGEVFSEGGALPTAGSNIIISGQDVGLANPSIFSQIGYWIQNNMLLTIGIVGAVLLVGGGRRR